MSKGDLEGMDLKKLTEMVKSSLESAREELDLQTRGKSKGKDKETDKETDKRSEFKEFAASFDTCMTSQIRKDLLAPFKAMCVNHLDAVVKEDIARHPDLEAMGLPKFAKRHVANAIASQILGRLGPLVKACLPDDDDDEDADDQGDGGDGEDPVEDDEDPDEDPCEIGCVQSGPGDSDKNPGSTPGITSQGNPGQDPGQKPKFSFKERIMWFVGTRAKTDKLKKTLTAFAETPVEELRDRFMPREFKELMKKYDPESGFRALVKSKLPKQVGKVLAFIRRVNHESFKQALFPGANVKASQFRLTTTVLARAVSSFVNSKGKGRGRNTPAEKRKITDALDKQLQLVAPRLAEITGLDFLKEWRSFSWGTKDSLGCHPILLWHVVFPRLLAMVESQRRAKGPKEAWTLMCCGCATTNGRTINFLVLDPSKPTMRKSKTAQKLGLTPNEYAYNNLLSVSDECD